MFVSFPQFAMAKVVRMETKLTVQLGGLHEVVKAAEESLGNGDFDKLEATISALPKNSQQLVKDALKNQYFNTEDLDKDR